MAKDVIYLDHAATSWPKPPEVIRAVVEAMEQAGANAGRGSHSLAVDSGRLLVRARMELAQLFGIRNAQDLAFCYNTTMALNMAIQGTLKPGDHVIATMAEHNSVRRPLEYLRRTRGVEVDFAEVDADGYVNLSHLGRLFRPNTKLVVCTHSSNLLGSIQPVGEIGDLAKSRGARFLVDAAQSAGSLDIDVSLMNIDLLAFPGHKGLLGPQGTGGLYIAPDLDLEPILTGGTGSQSENREQPDVRPDRYESGTQNVPGIAGLLAGVRRVREWKPGCIHRREWEQVQMLMEGLQELPGIRLLGPRAGEERSGLIAFTVKGLDSARVAHRLDREFGIAVRAGMHCAPLAHEAMGTLASGAVRASVGVGTTEDEVRSLLEAMRHILGAGV
ncbi:aminotransferase class V-fold PLP-dependent enzyme [Paenibacillus spiritus]|uniref:cysteine desulfurase n=1 Tax=Paenibacillus spiritus TaxID=2496557 RepID=A0A5J5GAS5_9BACL|nr:MULTISPECIES: aminotransferase class V-fold PLP-dependent enzyme [Paenibacillus]KAA9005138.1 aminotransferase class V-fold PLP-dependent enzyme [Paenibacillus spiritus]